MASTKAEQRARATRDGILSEGVRRICTSVLRFSSYSGFHYDSMAHIYGEDTPAYSVRLDQHFSLLDGGRGLRLTNEGREASLPPAVYGLLFPSEIRRHQESIESYIACACLLACLLVEKDPISAHRFGAD